MKPGEIKKRFLIAQQSEITEYFIYKKVARQVKDPHNRKILERIAEDERKYYNYWEKITQTKIQPRKLKVFFYFLIGKVFGLTFGIKLTAKEMIQHKKYILS